MLVLSFTLLTSNFLDGCSSSSVRPLDANHWARAEEQITDICRETPPVCGRVHPESLFQRTTSCYFLARRGSDRKYFSVCSRS